MLCNVGNTFYHFNWICCIELLWGHEDGPLVTETSQPTFVSNKVLLCFDGILSFPVKWHTIGCSLLKLHKLAFLIQNIIIFYNIVLLFHICIFRTRIFLNRRVNFIYLLHTELPYILFSSCFFLWAPSAYASGSTSALWLIVLSPYWTSQLSPSVPRCHVP